MIQTLSRRKLLTGLGLLIAAPALVKASSLMPVKAYAAVEAMPSFDGAIWINVDGVMYYSVNDPVNLTWSHTSDPNVWEATEYFTAIAAEPLHAGQPVVLR